MAARLADCSQGWSLFFDIADCSQGGSHFFDIADCSQGGSHFFDIADCSQSGSHFFNIAGLEEASHYYRYAQKMTSFFCAEGKCTKKVVLLNVQLDKGERERESK